MEHKLRITNMPVGLFWFLALIVSYGLVIAGDMAVAAVCAIFHWPFVWWGFPLLLFVATGVWSVASIVSASNREDEEEPKEPDTQEEPEV